ncbi:hypothetical protein WJX74_008834 [Apatococcus lobatus]|uniref:SET domain-containing protein n=1 Tax=Apatococcus lobatus TaxID=904363 RepID=A0AAW1RDY0_9CHLO
MSGSNVAVQQWLADRLRLSRALSTDATEAYFMISSEHLTSFVSFRNEASAAATVLKQLTREREGQYTGSPRMDCLKDHCHAVTRHHYIDDAALSVNCKDLLAEDLVRWAEEQGCLVKGHTAAHSNGLRGFAANANMKAGDVLLSVPESLLISQETALSSDLGGALRQLPGLDADNILLIWTMVERHEADSTWAPFWKHLPDQFGTALGVSEEDIELLRDTPHWEAFSNAHQHVRQAYAALKPTLDMLTTAYPEQLSIDLFTWPAYLWAIELWYAYAIEVKGLNETISPCLVPVATLLNHALWPHIVHFSHLDDQDDCLKLRLFREVLKGQECCLSYGPLPNHKLLLFYGFTIADNPYDTIEFELGHAEDELQGDRAKALEMHDLPRQHMLRQGPLSSRLLPSLAIMAADRKQLQDINSGTPPLEVRGLCMDDQLSSLIDLVSGYLSTCRTCLRAVAKRLRNQLQPAEVLLAPQPHASADEHAPAPSRHPAASGCLRKASIPDADRISGHVAASDAVASVEKSLVVDETSGLPSKGDRCIYHQDSSPGEALPASSASHDANALSSSCQAAMYGIDDAPGDQGWKQVQREGEGPAADNKTHGQHDHGCMSNASLTHKFYSNAAQYLTGICTVLEQNISTLADLNGQNCERRPY